MKLSRCEICFLFFLLHLCVFKSQELEDSEGGDFLFFSKNEEISEESHHLTGKRKAASKPNCEESTLSLYLVSLQVINPESVIALATKNKLGNKCHNISKTINKMESYLKTCNLEPEQGQYLQLLKGVKALHNKLCNKDPYKKSFMEYKKCYGQLQTEVANSCNGPADWSDNSDRKRVCRAYQEIRDCYYIKASVMCGNKAADIFKELVQCIIESVITVNCTVSGLEGDLARPSKEQRLMMQKQKLGQTETEQVETAFSPSLCMSDPLHLLMIFMVVFLSKLVEYIF